MSMYDKNHYNTVISLQLIKINEKKIKIRRNKEEYRLHPGIFYSNIQTNAKGKIFKSSQKEGQRHFKQKQCKAEDNVTTLIKC